MQEKSPEQEKTSVERILEVLRRVVPSVRRTKHPRRDGADLVLTTTKGEHLVLEIKRVASQRRDDLLGRLALASLQLRKLASSSDVAIIGIVLPRLTDGLERAALDFMEEFAPGLGLCLVGEDSSARVEIPALRVQFAKRGKRTAEDSVPRRTQKFFAGANAWMLKILLLVDSPVDLWSGPRIVPRTATDLARLAGVSTAHAHRLVRTLEERDYLRRTSEGLTVVRRAQLITAWMDSYAYDAPPRVPVRPLFGKVTHLKEIFSVPTSSGDPSYAITSFEACRHLGLLHTTYTGAEVFVEPNLESAMHRWNLTHDTDSLPSIMLMKARSRQSIFGGAVTRGGLTITDVLQVALDASTHAARGREQAEHILRGVLRWRD